MDELRQLIRQYDPYYEMSDDSKTWHRGSQIASSHPGPGRPTAIRGPQPGN